MKFTKIKKAFLLSIFIIGGIIFWFIIINEIIFNAVFPDVCVYHFTEYKPGFWEALFFSVTGASNDHPEVGFFNLFIVVLLGVLTGILIYKILRLILNRYRK
jgi:hypothetical protein